MKYGYARVSTKKQLQGTSLDDQETALVNAGAEQVFKDAWTGTTNDRPEFDRLLSSLHTGDELIVTKLDRIARSVDSGSKLIKDLLDQGVTVRILNFGVLDNSPNGRLMYHIFLSFAEFERDMIYERTQGGRAYKRATDPNYKEGRHHKWSKSDIERALTVKETHSIAETVRITGIPRSTLMQAYRRQRAVVTM